MNVSRSGTGVASSSLNKSTWLNCFRLTCRRNLAATCSCSSLIADNRLTVGTSVPLFALCLAADVVFVAVVASTDVDSQNNQLGVAY